MKEQNSSPLQHLEIVIIGSYFDGEIEIFQRGFSMGFVTNPIEESVQDFPAEEEYHSNLTLIDVYGIAVSTVNANFSKYK